MGLRAVFRRGGSSSGPLLGTLHLLMHDAADPYFLIVRFVKNDVLPDAVSASAGTGSSHDPPEVGEPSKLLNGGRDRCLGDALSLRCPRFERVLEDVAQVSLGLGRKPHLTA